MPDHLDTQHVTRNTMSLKHRLAHRLFGDIIQQELQAQLAQVTVRVDDSPGWEQHGQAGPTDRPWHELYTDLEDALDAWRKNFLVRRIVTLTRSYVIGGGIQVTSEIPEVDQFIRQFWDHPKNRMDLRLGAWCDELTRAGEIFPVLFTNRLDGMSYIRAVPASCIREIRTDDDDYETELEYGEIQEHTVELRWWVGLGHRHAYRRARGGQGGHFKPLMIHFAVNRPVGATRGEGDLTPILPWAKRYSEWLKDRVRLNRQRTRQGVLEIEIADPAMVQEKKQQLRTRNPLEHGIYVHGPGETVKMHNLEIEAAEAADDGKVLRLAVAAGSNLAMHYLGEGEHTNYASAKEMGEPTARFHSERQRQLCKCVTDLITAAYKRKCVIGQAAWPEDGNLQLKVSTTEVARADNQALASAARNIVIAFKTMHDLGWITDELAIELCLKFAGEVIGQEQIKQILAETKPETQTDGSTQ